MKLDHGNTMRTAALPTIQRLPLLLRHVQERIAEGEEYISSVTLAEEVNLDPILVRKCLASTGAVGVPRLGFRAKELEAAIVRFLGWDNATDAILCGVGNLGRALLGYHGFSQFGLRIIAAFDVKPSVVGQKIHGVSVFSVEKMYSLISRMKIRLGILTVPAESSQEMAENMIHAGIQGVWNFTPVKLKVPESVIVQRVDLASSLAVLSHTLALRGK